MSGRVRAVAFGTAAALVVAGAACAAFVGGVTGELLTIVLISIGLGGALLLVFLEIGLGEESELAREQERKRRREQRAGATSGRVRRFPRRPRRPG